MSLQLFEKRLARLQICLGVLIVAVGLVGSGVLLAVTDNYSSVFGRNFDFNTEAALKRQLTGGVGVQVPEDAKAKQESEQARRLIEVEKELADGRDCEIEARDQEYKDFAGVHYMWKPDEDSDYWYVRMKQTGDEVKEEIVVTSTGEKLTERFYKKGRGVRTDDEKGAGDTKKTWKFVDNSFGTYTTYYILAIYWAVWFMFECFWTFLAFLFGTKLWSRAPLLVWVGAMAAGAFSLALYHHGCSDYEDDCHSNAYNRAFMFVALAGAMLSIGAASIFLNVLPRSMNRNLYIVVSIIIIVLWVIVTAAHYGGYLDEYEFIVGAISQQVIPFAVFGVALVFSNVLHPISLKLKFALVNYVIGVAFCWGGYVVQHQGDWACGKPCPEDCRYFIPHLNHNSIFNLLVLMGSTSLYKGVELTLKYYDDLWPGSKAKPNVKDKDSDGKTKHAPPVKDNQL